MNWLTGFLTGLALALAISSRAETVYASVWTFSGDNTWTPQEWRGLVESAYQILEEKTDVRIRVASWTNEHSSPCKKYQRYKSEKTYGNCLRRREVDPLGPRKGFNLLLTAPIILPHGDTGIGGLSTGICQVDLGTAMIHGKRISTHVFKDGGNAGWEMTRLAILHESIHILGAHHPDEVGRATPINIMDTETLEYLVDEYQVKVNGVYTNFREALPLVKFSRYEIHKCLN